MKRAKTDFGNKFEEFRKVFPHRDGTRDRETAGLLWTGKLPLKDKVSRITPDMHDNIVEGAKLHADQNGNDPYRWNECRWLRAKGWVNAFEVQEEQERIAQERGAKNAEEDRERRRQHEFNQAYYAWKTEQVRAGRNKRDLTPEEFKATRGPQLKVVGES